MKLGLRFFVSVDILTMGIVCLALSNLTMWYLKSHPIQPCVVASKEPTIEITQTLFVPVPKVIVRVVPAPTPKPDVQVQPEKNSIEEVPEQPVFRTKGVVIPDSLHHSIEAMTWHASANQNR